MGPFRLWVLRLDRALGAIESVLLAVCVAAITGITFAQVVARYALSSPIIWSEEAARYLFVWITLIGAAAAVRSHGHFGLDILRKYFPQIRVPLGAATMLVVAAFLALLFHTGLIETRQASTQMAAALPMNMHWPYMALPVGAGLALFHVLAHWVRDGIAAHPLDASPETRTEQT